MVSFHVFGFLVREVFDLGFLSIELMKARESLMNFLAESGGLR